MVCAVSSRRGIGGNWKRRRGGLLPAFLLPTGAAAGGRRLWKLQGRLAQGVRLVRRREGWARRGYIQLLRDPNPEGLEDPLSDASRILVGLVRENNGQRRYQEYA